MQHCKERSREDVDDAHVRNARRLANEAADGGFQGLKAALVEALLAKRHAEDNVTRLCRELEIGLERHKRELRLEVIDMYRNAGMDDPAGTFRFLETQRAQLHHDRQEFEKHRQELLDAKREFKKRKREEELKK